MKLFERTIISEQLKKIINTHNIKIGRAANLIWIAFHSRDGREYALHLQTLFRFCDGEKVLIADGDKYQPIKSIKDAPAFLPENFEWDKQGNNLLDEWVSSCQSTLINKLIVKDVKVNPYGDFEIIFSQNITLSVLIDTTSNDECCRFFEYHSKKPHLVVTGEGIQNPEDFSSDANGNGFCQQ